MVASYNSQGYPKRSGEEQCSFFVKNGQCKFGGTCKLDHPEFIYPGVDFNSRGFPLRPDETECEFYAKTQECKFGCKCKYNHPEPAAQMGPPKLKPLAQPTFGLQQTTHTHKTAVRPMMHQQMMQPQMSMNQGGINSQGFPMRPGQQLCAFYLKEGTCKFGSTCKYDHPEKGGNSMVVVQNIPGLGMVQQTMRQQQPMQMQMGGGSNGEPDGYNQKGYPIRYGAGVCQFYAKNGDCKFGKTCKWDHSDGNQQQQSSGGRMASNQSSSAGSNSKGLPIRPGQEPCAFFVKSGDCKFGATCKFDHPEAYCGNSGNSGSNSKDMFLNDDTVFADAGMNSRGHPIRPGGELCSFFAKSGECKFGETCKFDHPEDYCRQGKAGGFHEVVSCNSQGFPLRPGQNPCTFYMQTGQCKFGDKCKWDHPEGMGGTQPGGFQKTSTNKPTRAIPY